MKTKKLTQKQCQKLVKDYRSNTLPEATARELEEVNHVPIEKIIQDLEMDLNDKKYNVCRMTVTTARKLLKVFDRLTPSEIELYERFSGRTFPEVINAAHSIVSDFEERKQQLQHAKEERAKYRNAWMHALSLDTVQQIEANVSKYFADSITLSACTSSDFVECHFMGITPITFDSKGKKIADTLNNENDLFRFSTLLESDFKQNFGGDTVLTIKSVDSSSYDCLDINIKIILA